MPRFNGTGPTGAGPGTGWGMGPCGGGMAYGRRGMGRGQGFDRQRFQGNYIAPTSSEEREVLEQEIKDIKSRLAQLKVQK